MKGPELEIQKKYEAMGYTVFRNGWPDLLVVKDGKGFAVEVKTVGTGGEHVADNQIEMQGAMATLGIATTMEWVETEVYKAKKAAREEKKRVTYREYLRRKRERYAARRKALTNPIGLDKI